MHPSEMKHSALAAAAKAKQDGFAATAEAFLFLAEVCAEEARELARVSRDNDPRFVRNSPLGGGRLSVVSH